MPFGTHSALDSLVGNFQYMHQLNRDDIYDQVKKYIGYQNEIMDEFIGEFAEKTTDSIRRYGGSSAPFVMQKLNSAGRNLVQKTAISYDILGFPIDRYGEAIQWDRDYMRRHTADQFANTVMQIGFSDARNIYYNVRNAFFNPNNYTYNESQNYLSDWQANDIPDIPVKALANGDAVGWNGAETAYPVRPDGTKVAPDHNHYLAVNSTVITKDSLTALINTVTEHQSSGNVVVAINIAQEEGIRALAPDFIAYTNPHLILPAQAGTTRSYTVNGITYTEPLGVLPNQNSLDDWNTYNRRIGMFKMAEVWVKQWVPVGYVICYIKDEQKVLAFRYRDNESSELRLVADENVHPLSARQYEREFGVSVKERLKAAVLQLRNDNNAYQMPVL